jgi:hypothetical protein
MTNPQFLCRNLLKVLVCIWIGTLAIIFQARADYLFAGRSEYWGKVTAITNTYLEFQVNCTGTPKKFKWKKGAFAVTFSEGCKPTNIESWGEPVNCRKRGRTFVAGNAGASSYYDFVRFEDDVLILGSRAQKAQVKAPRKEQTAIWLGCE